MTNHIHNINTYNLHLNLFGEHPISYFWYMSRFSKHIPDIIALHFLFSCILLVINYKKGYQIHTWHNRVCSTSCPPLRSTCTTHRGSSRTRRISSTWRATRDRERREGWTGPWSRRHSPRTTRRAACLLKKKDLYKIYVIAYVTFIIYILHPGYPWRARPGTSYIKI